MIAMLINDQVGILAWPSASAMSMVLLVLVLAATALLSRLTGAGRAVAVPP
jgi:ABC-type spermidine/putrescine transport system permease subunit I